jgi:hypothetical protein
MNLPRSVSTAQPVRNAVRTRRARRSGEHVSQLVRRATDGDQCAWNELVDEFDELVSPGFRS